MSLPSDLKRETSLLIGGALQWFRRHWRPFVTFQILLLVAIWAGLHPYDHELLKAVRGQPFGMVPKETLVIAGEISHWGDFPGFNVILAITLWLAGVLFCRPRWKRLALMTVLCAAFAGISTNVLRFGIGRSRPQVKQDGFYGPRFSNLYQSCPSGHTTTAFAAAIPLVIAAPPLGVATTLIATSVGWSRMFVNRHYPADIAMAVWMALWFALPLGFAARVRRISDEPYTSV
ncbi:MAG: pgpB [Verrucomicrobiaceae bacterium]|nr:pgpB [Verrucomicrobiaceae bacterium]MDB6118199.1 pgpB [Verrucomicrobiaceae bacterium]